MQIRKFIVAMFLLFAFGVSFQPAYLGPRQRHVLTCVIDSVSDRTTSDFIKKNETRRFYTLVSLALQIMQCCVRGTLSKVS